MNRRDRRDQRRVFCLRKMCKFPLCQRMEGSSVEGIQLHKPHLIHFLISYLDVQKGVLVSQF